MYGYSRHNSHATKVRHQSGVSRVSSKENMKITTLKLPHNAGLSQNNTKTRFCGDWALIKHGTAGSAQALATSTTKGKHRVDLRLRDVLERKGLSLNLLWKLVMFWILEKYFVALEYFPASLKVLQQLWNCSLLDHWLHWTLKKQEKTT